MPSWVEQISANGLGAYGAAVIGVLIVILLIILILRLLFGGRLRMKGSRQRLPRLGIVDAFSLDRQRQLVIVRRDNIEHLILIGGPNDLLIESEIIRVEARDSREQRPREREFKDMGVVPAPNGAVRAPVAAMAGLTNLPLQSEESNWPSASGVPDAKPEPVQAASALPAVSPAAVSLSAQLTAVPSPSARPLPRVTSQGLETPPRAQQEQTAAGLRTVQPGAQTTVPSETAAAAERQGPSFETASIPRPVFTLPPRPNPFPIPPRRAPVTTPLPKTLLPREASSSAHKEQENDKPGMPKAADPVAKIEPSFTPRPSLLRSNLGSSQPASLARQSTTAGSPQEAVPLPSGQRPEPEPNGTNETHLTTADSESKPPSIASAGPLNLTQSPPSEASAVPVAVEQAKPEQATPAGAGSAEAKQAEERKVLAEGEVGDPINALEAEMAKLLGRE